MSVYKKMFKICSVLTLVAMTSFTLANSISSANQEPISIFPLNNYDQTISNWIKPSDPDFDKPLLTAEMQQKRLDLFYDHDFGSLSPWSEDLVIDALRNTTPDYVKTIVETPINDFTNDDKSEDLIGYGENFRPYQKSWMSGIVNNINLSQFDHLTYQQNNRGIAIDNLHARALPTDDVHFYNYKNGGQGYPFDNLQMSSVWAGTPVYILGETQDKAWMLVMTPDFIGWVKSTGIARASQAFISSWARAAKNKLVAITHTQTSLIDGKGNFLFSAYVGSVFPGYAYVDGILVMVPAADEDHYAVIKYAKISSKQGAFMPMVATPHHFAMIMSTLIARPYGWGGIYFYNDCSAELKSLFTPFGIWLPRNSSQQNTAGVEVDKTSSSPEQRLAYLMQNGKPFLTIVYIGGHVVLYIGNYANPHKNNEMMAMTYQDVWGLRPSSYDARAVIGKSVIFPMLLQYPEAPNLISLADKKHFEVIYLNQLPDNHSTKTD